MFPQELLVVIPHSGIAIPAEIPVESLSEQLPSLIRNIDWHTSSLYDFRDILGNRQMVFPYCSMILEANRHPDAIDDSVPLKDVFGRPVYKSGFEPGLELRTAMSAKYITPFHDCISDSISAGAGFLLDGHSTVTARGVADDQIDLMNYQHSDMDKGKIYFCPDIYVETYAEELRKRLPEVKVTVNDSKYCAVYGHVCAAHSVNAMRKAGGKAPAFIQETNQHLYMNSDMTPDIRALNRLRLAFAISIRETFKILSRMETGL